MIKDTGEAGRYALRCADGVMHAEHDGTLTGDYQCALDAATFMDEISDDSPWTCGPHAVVMSACGHCGGPVDGDHFASGGVMVCLNVKDSKAAKPCRECERQRAGSFGPSHDGMSRCRSYSIASGGTNAHCTCDTCF